MPHSLRLVSAPRPPVVSRPWGFQIAGLSVQIVGDGPRFHPAGFAPTLPPTLTLHAAAVAVGERLRPEGEAAAEQDSWAAFCGDGQVTLLGKSGYADPAEVIRIDLPDENSRGAGAEVTEGTLRYRPETGVVLLTFPLDQLLVIQLLASRRGLVIHGAAVGDDERAVLLIGPSGAGKTTTARAAADAGLAVLSDERSVVRWLPDQGGGFRIAGTPWYGDGSFFDGRFRKLVAICALSQSDHDALEPLSPARMLAELYRCHFPPVWSERAAAATLATAETLVGSVPLYRLHNRRGGGAVELVRSLL